MRWHAIAIASVLVVATQASAAEKKYGAGESDSHIEKVFSGSLTALGFQQKKNWMYTVYKQPHMRIELSVVSVVGQRMGWRLIFENLYGMAQMEKQRRSSEEAAF